MEERMTLYNMVIKAGGKNGVMPADAPIATRYSKSMQGGDKS
jgi:homoaconitase/3-isopropylmalate dehydratase large subunit